MDENNICGLKKKDLLLISTLRENSRETLTNISKKISMPISTIFDRLRFHQKNLIIKHTTLIDFSQLGYTTRATLTLKVNKKDREPLKEFLEKHPNVNSVYKINNGYDFLIEAVFRNLKDMEDFVEGLDERFKLKARQTYYVIEDIKREAFLSDPGLTGMIVS